MDLNTPFSLFMNGKGFIDKLEEGEKLRRSYKSKKEVYPIPNVDNGPKYLILIYRKYVLIQFENEFLLKIDVKKVNACGLIFVLSNIVRLYLVQDYSYG